jgi:hydroxypyruvate isomerase
VFGRNMPLDDCCREAARLGCKGFDLLGPADWPVLKKYGLVPSMNAAGAGGSIPDALNRTENHDKIEKSLRAGIGTAANGVPNVITFSEIRGLDDRQAPTAA